MKIRDEPPPKFVELPCGCEYVAHHRIGERMYRCTNHSRRWVIIAEPPKEVEYSIHELGGGYRETVEVRNREKFG